MPLEVLLFRWIGPVDDPDGHEPVEVLLLRWIGPVGGSR